MAGDITGRSSRTGYNVAMILPPLRLFVVIAFELLAACGSQSSIKPAEVLDERSGMTVGSLEKPIELVQGVQSMISPERRVSFAYLGPVEWDNMGNISYGLWVHLAPGNDWRFDDIRAPGAVSLSLDDGTAALSVIEAPKLAHGPYQPVASWGQTAYFDLDVQTLKRMASSGKIELDFKANGGSMASGASVVRFTAGIDARDTLMRYLHARGY
jgi:hypothetical protein